MIIGFMFGCAFMVLNDLVEGRLLVVLELLIEYILDRLLEPEGIMFLGAMAILYQYYEHLQSLQNL